MAHHTNVRVRLDFVELISEFTSLPPLCWMLIDKTTVYNIYSFKSLIKSRYGISKKSKLQLYLQSCLLPDEESIDLLRDNDLIRVALENKFSCIAEKECNLEKNVGLNLTNLNKDGHDEKKLGNNFEGSNLELVSVDSRELTKRISKKKKHRKKHTSITEEAHPEKDLFASQQEDILSDSAGIQNGKAKKHVTSMPSSTEINETTKQNFGKEHNSRPNLNKCTEGNTSNSISYRLFQLSKSRSSQDAVIFSEGSTTKVNNGFEQTDAEIVKSQCSFPAISTTMSPQITISAESSCLILDEPVENKDQIVKKKRTRKRKRKVESFEEFPMAMTLTGRPTSSEAESTPLRFSRHSSGFGKHIRFEEDRLTLEREVSESDAVEEIDSSRRDDSTVFKDLRNSDGKSNESFKEMSKEKQINSICTNKSIILLNCFGTYSNQKTKEHASPAVKAEFQMEANSHPAVNKSEDFQYQRFPQLNGPPRVGDLIAYKILELSSTYCPEVSMFKEGRVINSRNDVLDIKLADPERKQTQNGKFELQYSDEEEMEEWTDIVQVNWSDMIDPRLLNEPHEPI